jgi:hypothetical protein
MEQKIQELCDENNAKLLYVVKFGSTLYGTNTPASDVDYKGIFLPSKEDCFLLNASKLITYSTGKNDSKNTDEDIDIQLWSLQYFLQLVAKGETGALDLLFSFTHPEIIEYVDYRFERIFNHYDELFDVRDCNAFVGYAIGQAKKYGIKGSRLGKLKQVFRKTKSLGALTTTEFKKLDDVIDVIVDTCYDKSLCFIKVINNVRSLVLNGKVHNGTIKLSEFCDGVGRDFEKYGDRTKQAELCRGIDFKAMSHAYRALVQMKELINTGKITFPLKERDVILDIKSGNKSWKEMEDMISDGIEEIDKRLKDPNLIVYNKKNKTFIREFLLSFYK